MKYSKRLIGSLFFLFCLSSLTSEALAGKTSFPLLRENFSQDQDLNVTGIYKQIGYKFKDEALLRAALGPLLPKRLQLPKQQFDRLEFLGDSVLSLIIRERILALFPTEERGRNVKLYQLLTKNDTLADVYVQNLGIEPYIPYPERPFCKYCNVVEAIIGAIYQDAGVDRGLKCSRTFIMKILNDHILVEKLEEIASRLPSEGNEGEDVEQQAIPVLPRLQEIFETLAGTKAPALVNPKSFLSEFLLRAWNTAPVYTISLGRFNEAPVFIGHVSGPQIGSILYGVGLTEDQAERDAARTAINFLAQKELIPSISMEGDEQAYTNIVTRFCHKQRIPIETTSKVSALPPQFTFQARTSEALLGEGTGPSKKEAEEAASQRAAEHLIDNGTIIRESLDSEKKYKTNLKELGDQGKAPEVLYSLTAETQSENIYRFLVTLDGVGFEAEAMTLIEAREMAYRQAFECLLIRQNTGNSRAEITPYVRVTNSGEQDL